MKNMSTKWIVYNLAVKCLEIKISVAAGPESQKLLEYTKLPHLLEEVEVSHSLSSSGSLLHQREISFYAREL